MAWTLSINTIDVQQGESALVLAKDDASGAKRSMLIDGGKGGQAGRVNQYLLDNLGDANLDHILITHYDLDHSGGIINLLEADNFYDICDFITITTVAELAICTNRAQRVAVTSAAVWSLLMGAYKQSDGTDQSADFRLACVTAMFLVSSSDKNIEAAETGLKQAISTIPDPMNGALTPSRSTAKRKETALNAGLSIGSHTDPDTIAGLIFKSVFASLKTLVKSKPQFYTGGKMNFTQVIDTGDTAGIPDDYLARATGFVMMSTEWIRAPRIKRRRGNPDLGDEIMWNSGRNPIAAPADAPEIFVMARNRLVWNGTNKAIAIPGGTGNNNDSYALMLRFNKFFFYTGGDLETEGEDLIARSIMKYKLAGIHAIPDRIAAFKCGHHGANTCTSDDFLKKIKARTAIISCGNNSYGHPNQLTVNRLHSDTGIRYFYLTGCPTETDNIPATSHPAGNQLTSPGNKSRVAGGIAFPAGDISLRITQAQSTSSSATLPLKTGDTAIRAFDIYYYDYDAPQAYNTESTTF